MYSWKLSCLACYILLQIEKEKTQRKRWSKGIHMSAVCFKTFWLQWQKNEHDTTENYKGHDFFSGSHYAFGPWGDINKYQQLKENKNLKAIVVPRVTARAPKHSQGTWCTAKCLTQGCMVCLKTSQWKSSDCIEISVVYQYRKWLQHNQRVVMLI